MYNEEEYDLDDVTFSVMQRYEEDKYSLIGDMVEQMLDGKGYSHDQVQLGKEAVLRREQHATTGLESGVAVPHGKTREVNRLHLGFFVVKEGIDFKAMDGKPTYFLLCIVVPPTVDYIGLLISVIATFAAVVRRLDLSDVTQVDTTEELELIIRNAGMFAEN